MFPPGVSRKQIHIHGTAQEVGFRPFVYHLAQKLGLKGYVLNSSAGVTIEVEGGHSELECFVRGLTDEPPPLAQVEDVTIQDLAPAGDTRFVIRESVDEPGRLVPISPDVSTCDDCIRDFLSAENPRHGYPFTNCINCGPRFTLTRKIPYDRSSTTMACFQMCDRRRREYDDPARASPDLCLPSNPGTLLIPLQRRTVVSGTSACAWQRRHSPILHRIIAGKRYSNPIDSIRLSSMNSIGSAHADLVPISPKILPVSTPDRMLIIIGRYSTPDTIAARRVQVLGRLKRKQGRADRVV